MKFKKMDKYDDIFDIHHKILTKIKKEYRDLSFSDISKYIEDAYSNINIEEILRNKRYIKKFYEYKKSIEVEVLFMKGKFDEFKKICDEPEIKKHSFYFHEWSIEYYDENYPEFVKFFAAEILRNEKERRRRQTIISDHLSREKKQYIETLIVFNNGNLEILKLLIKELKIDLSNLSPRDQYDFFHACCINISKASFEENDILKHIKYFIENGLDPLVKNQELFKHICNKTYYLIYKKKGFNIINFLVKYTCDRGKDIDIRGLLNAIDNSNKSLVQYLVKLYDEYFNINIYDLLRKNNYVVFMFVVRRYSYHEEEHRWKNILDFFIDRLIDYMQNSGNNAKDIISIKVFSYILLNYEYLSKKGKILDRIWRKNSDERKAKVYFELENKLGVKKDRKIDRLKRIDNELNKSFLEYKTNLSTSINKALPTKLPPEVVSKDVLKYLIVE